MGIPHLAIPFRIENGSVATVEQDSEDEIAQSVQVLVTTPKGFRREEPEYGVPPILFRQSNSPITNEILAATSKFEPRAKVDVSSQISDYDEFVRNIRILVRPADVNH